MQTTNRFFLGVSLLFIFIFFYILYIGTPNVATTLDDSRMFHQHFVEYWLNEDSFLMKLYYLIRMEKYPHTLIMGRIGSLISYVFLGEINMVLITVLGNIGLLFIWFSAFKLIKNENCAIYIFPITIILFGLNAQCFWTILSYMYTYTFFLTLVTFYFIESKHQWLSFISAFLVLFDGGAGFLVFPLVLFYLSYLQFYQGNMKMRLAIWIVFSVGLLILFYLVTFALSEPTGFSNNETKADVFSLFDRLLSHLTYFIVTVGKIFYKYYLVGGIIMSSILVFVLLSVPLRHLQYNRTDRVLILSLIYISGVIAVACIVRDDISIIWEEGEKRYLYYSKVFSIPLLIIIINRIGKSNYFYYSVLLVNILLIGYFAINFQDTFSNIKTKKLKNDTAYLNALVGDHDTAPFLCRVRRDLRLKCLENSLLTIDNDVFDYSTFDIIIDNVFDVSNIEIMDTIIKINGSPEVYNYNNIYKFKDYFSFNNSIKFDNIAILAIGKNQSIVIDNVKYKKRRKSYLMSTFAILPKDFQLRRFDILLSSSDVYTILKSK